MVELITVGTNVLQIDGMLDDTTADFSIGHTFKNKLIQNIS
jgi:hypothetical protein